MRRDLAAPRSPADGGGRASVRVLRPTDGVLRAGRRAVFEIEFEVGPLGIADGGTIYFQVSPFWGWSTPQVEDPQAPGFTTLNCAPCAADGVGLKAVTLDQGLLAITVSGAELAPERTLSWTYGSGPAAARLDRFAERGERLWIAVDGDGDGVRRLIESSPSVDILPGEATRLVAFGPATARPGEEVLLHVSLLDGAGNGPVDVPGRLWVETPQGEVRPDEAPALDTEPRQGTRFVPWTFDEPGIQRLKMRFEGDGGEAFGAVTPPILVAPQGPGLFWADLQIHSRWSDGSGEPQDLYRYGRDVARLDVMGLTDHDHWGLRFLDAEPPMWKALQEVTESFHKPGSFVTVRGYEWTSWIHGHRHVLVFDDAALTLRSSIDDSFDHPAELWASLRGRRALTVAHHSAGGPIAVDWSIAPDPELEPVTEVVSVHGSSEAADSPRRIGSWVEGNSVRQAALGRGYRLGFIGSTDGHDGHPGLAHLVSPSGGLAGILATELSRDAVYDALKARRTFATSGPRIVLRTLVAGYRMGADVPVRDGAVVPIESDARLPMERDRWWVQVAGTGELERIDWIGPHGVRSMPCEGLDCTLSGALPSLKSGEFLYVRAVQTDGHFAVSSPYFFIAAPRAEAPSPSRP